MGARPLRRVIQQKVEDTLSDALLAKQFNEGDTIVIDLNEEGQLILRKPEVEKEPEAPVGVGS